MEVDVKEEKLAMDLHIDEVDFPPNEYIFQKRDACFIIGGFGTYTLDWVFDILTAVNHWIHGHVIYFACTVLFVCFPSLTMTAVSLHWYLKDHNNSHVPRASTRRWIWRILLLIIQLGPLMRVTNQLNTGRRRRDNIGHEIFNKMLYTKLTFQN
ncbi:unnamed protein product, partial [Meganyctiphanes norvegica]